MTKYSPELWEAIFQRYHKGEPIARIARDPGMPTRIHINERALKENWKQRSQKIKEQTQHKINTKLSNEDLKHYKITDTIIGLGLEKRKKLRITGDTVLKAVETQRKILGKDVTQIEAKITNGITPEDLEDAVRKYRERPAGK
jgi:replicative superfamily II helicase